MFIWKYCNLRCLSKIVVEGTSYNWMLRQAKRKDHRHFSHSAILSIFTLPNLQNLQQEPRGAVPFGCRIYCCLFTKGRTCNQTIMSGRRLNRFIDFAAFLLNVDSACRGLFSSFLVRKLVRPRSEASPFKARRFDRGKGNGKPLALHAASMKSRAAQAYQQIRSIAVPNWVRSASIELGHRPSRAIFCVPSARSEIAVRVAVP